MYKRQSIGVSTLLKIGQYGKLDTLPTKIYEYMAMGLPVIMSNTDYNIKKMCIRDSSWARCR